MKSNKWYKANNAPRTITVTAARTLLDSESGSTIVFEGATDLAVTMPSAEVGMEFSFLINAADVECRITPVTLEQMSLATGALSAASKYVNNVEETVGTFYKFICFNKTEWTCVLANGTLEAEG